MASKDEATKETQLDMTSMIDVTFLLLIFFLCSIKFKVLEGKIPAYLPKDVGVNATPVDKQLEKIEIFIRRTKPVETDPRVNQDWVWSADQIQVKIGPRVIPFAELAKVVEGAHKANPDAKATLYPEAGSLYIDSVKVVNECLRVSFTDITFAGAPREL